MGVFFPLDFDHGLQWHAESSETLRELSYTVAWTCPACHADLACRDCADPQSEIVCPCGARFHVTILLLRQVPIPHAPPMPYVWDDPDDPV